MLHQGSSPLTLLSAECLSSFVGRKDRSDFGDRIEISTCRNCSSVVLLGTTVTRAENGQIARGIQAGLIGGALAGPPVYAAPPPPPPVYCNPHCAPRPSL
jgi:hypothetical protein